MLRKLEQHWSAAPGERVRPGTVIAGMVIHTAFTRPVPVSSPSIGDFRDGRKTLLVSAPFFVACALWVVSLLEIFQLRGSLEPLPESAPSRTLSSDSRIPA